MQVMQKGGGGRLRPSGRFAWLLEVHGGGRESPSAKEPAVRQFKQIKSLGFGLEPIGFPLHLFVEVPHVKSSARGGFGSIGIVNIF